MCLTERGLNIILRLLATLPVGRRGPLFSTTSGLFLLRNSLVCISFPPVAVGRERDTLGCAGVETSPRTLFRSATIILMFGRTPDKRSWLCTSIISWQPLPKVITTQLKRLKQFDRRKVFRL